MSERMRWEVKRQERKDVGVFGAERLRHGVYDLLRGMGMQGRLVLEHRDLCHISRSLTLATACIQREEGHRW